MENVGTCDMTFLSWTLNKTVPPIAGEAEGWCGNRFAIPIHCVRHDIRFAKPMCFSTSVDGPPSSSRGRFIPIDGCEHGLPFFNCHESNSRLQ